VEEIDGVEVITLADAVAWDAWLAEHHARREGVWIAVAKLGSGVASVTSDELVDGGLCWGWISGQRRRLDDRTYLQRYVPRRPASLWSRVNVDKVDALLAAGRMQEPGLAEVRAAQADGRWDAAYVSQREATPPPELLDALARDPGARAAFEALDRSSQYQLYLPVLQARNATTRVARVERAVATLRST